MMFTAACLKNGILPFGSVAEVARSTRRDMFHPGPYTGEGGGGGGGDRCVFDPSAFDPFHPP